MKADLHIHTTHSDGEFSVLKVIDRAQVKGLDLIAITDHDNVDSYQDYLKLKDNLKIKVLIGVELSTWYRKENVHVLGYFYNNSDIGQELLEYLKEMKEKRIKRAKEFISNLKKFYDLDIEYDDVLKMAKDVVGRPHIARYVAEKYDMNVEEVFKKYLSSSSKAYVPSSNMSTKDAIDLLHRNNAIAIWAHPILNKGKFAEKDIIDMGIDGIEGYYPQNSETDTRHYRTLTNRYNLLFTAGSDFHDEVSHSDIGTCYIEDADINKLLLKLRIK